MFRRVVSSLALLCVVLGQTAPLALAHAHDGGQPAGHGSRPHSHLNPVRSGHSHHEHDGGGHHHHHADADAGDERPPPPRPAEPSDHDSDAVYLTGADAVPGSRAADDEVRSVSFDGIGLLAPAAVIRPSLVLAAANQSRPPPGQSCPLYVRHLAILI